MRLRRTLVLVLALLIASNVYPAMLASASYDGEYTLEYNVLDRVVEFSYGEVKAEITHPASATSPGSNRYRYQWAPISSFDGSIFFTNASNPGPYVYGRICLNVNCRQDHQYVEDGTIRENKQKKPS